MNLYNIGDSQNLRESEEWRVRSSFNNHGTECRALGSRGLLDEVIDEIRLLLFNIHLRIEEERNQRFGSRWCDATRKEKASAVRARRGRPSQEDSLRLSAIYLLKFCNFIKANYFIKTNTKILKHILFLFTLISHKNLLNYMQHLSYFKN